MAGLLVEIGTEELPLDSLDVIYRELKKIAAKKFTEQRLAFHEMRVEATPRRIAFFAEGVAARQEDQHLEIKGPGVDKAFDSAGKPTRALEGFLRSKEARLDQIEKVDTPRGKVVILRRREKGRPAAAVLPELLREIFDALPFPKLMRWEPTGFRFPRPVRWVMALLDERVLRFQLGDVKASGRSYGHRFLSPKALTPGKADWKAYVSALRKAHVILSLEEREAKITRGLSVRFKQKNFDRELVHITAQLVEEPFLLEGGFEKHYLDLPPDVLSTCMKKNQKIFAYRSAGGKLRNRFIAVMNGSRKGLARIRFDYENVLESRLKDARYFYDADTRVRLESRLDQLQQLMYLGELGSMKNKYERLEKLSPFFARITQHDDLAPVLSRASRLSKADLMTQMVFEFPNLQGIVGGEYARADGEDDAVSSAIATQYLPKNLAEDFQSLKKKMKVTGAMLGLMDRFDLLLGAFATGLEPSGSQDPYALRRAGGGFVKLVRAFELRFSLDRLAGENAALYGAVGLRIGPENLGEVMARLKQFLKERMIFELALRPGSRELEIFEAVWRSGCDDPADVFERYAALTAFARRDPDAFVRAGKVVERTGNIAKGLQDREEAVDPELFQKPLEKELFRLLEQCSAPIRGRVDERRYDEATRAFGEAFFQPLHDFFDQVMVNVEDEPVRRNRQALMRQINLLYTEKLADLSLLSKLEK